jgi:hypothetical protein
MVPINSELREYKLVRTYLDKLRLGKLKPNRSSVRRTGRDDVLLFER